MKLKNMFLACAATIFVLFAAACDSPEDSVEKFYEALYDGDFEEAKKYCSDDAAKALDILLAKLGEDRNDAVKNFRNDVRLEKKYFRFLTSDELDYQEREDEKQKKDEEKQKKERLRQVRTEAEQKDMLELEKMENAEKQALAGAKIIYTRWSKDLVYKHYLKWIGGRWRIVKIEFGHALPERLLGGN